MLRKREDEEAKKQNSGAAIRDYINSYGAAYGITDKDIGWHRGDGDNSSTGMVTLGGQDLIRPDRLDSEKGRSYVNDVESLRSAIDQYANNRGLVNERKAPETPTYEAPKEYVSPYSGKVNELFDRIQNMEKFQYNPEADLSFQNYKEQYNRQGQRSMEDAMGMAASLTGGRQSSWSETVGNQQKQQWDDRLMDRIPELEQMAYSRHIDTRNMTLQELNQLMAMDQQEYSRFADGRNFNRGMFESDRAFDRNAYDADRNFQRGAFESDRNYDFSQEQFGWQKDVDDRNYDFAQEQFGWQKDVDERNFDYQVSRDEVLDEQWMKQFTAAEQQRIIDNAFKSRQISVSERNAALSAAKFSYSKEQDKINNAAKANNVNTETLGIMYNSMMNAEDPSRWLINEAPYMTNDELKSLERLVPKDNDDLAKILQQLYR